MLILIKLIVFKDLTVVRGIYTAASGMMAERRKLDTVSNNLANIDRSYWIQKRFVYSKSISRNANKKTK